MDDLRTRRRLLTGTPKNEPADPNNPEDACTCAYGAPQKAR